MKKQTLLHIKDRKRRQESSKHDNYDRESMDSIVRFSEPMGSIPTNEDQSPEISYGQKILKRRAPSQGNSRNKPHRLKMVDSSSFSKLVN